MSTVRIDSKQKPATLGYRMPAEWEKHAATWFTWPRPEGISFPDKYEAVPPVYGELIKALTPHERVYINVWNEEMENQVRQQMQALKVSLNNVHFHHFPAYEPWCRDHGPIFIVNSNSRSPVPPIAIVDWKYNAWGNKYPPYDLDDQVPVRVGQALNLSVFDADIVMEGGSIDVNGRGTLLTTEACLLNPNRNPHLNKQQIEQYLKDYLGVTNILWLGDGIIGDDTDGHVDDLTRFVNPTTVVTVLEEDPADENHEILQENLKRLKTMKDEQGRPLNIVHLPMPARVEHEGQRLPASYANFYIANDVVLLPTYRDRRNDSRAQEIVQKCFPDRKVVPIDSTELIWGLGSFHCISQQQPAV